MKKTTILFCLLFAVINIFAQRNKDEQLEDSIFAWKPIPKLNPTAYPRTFSAAQLKYPELFARWLRKSYIPIGALDNSYAVAEPNKKEEVQPYGSGLCAAMWNAMWDNSGKHVVKVPHTEARNYILTNTIIDAEPIAMLSTPGRAVFTRRSPDIEKAFMGSSEKKNAFVKNLKLKDHPQMGKYIIQYYGCDGDGCAPMVAVYLEPDNKLPIRQLTRGELLDMIEQAIPKEKARVERIIPNEKHLAEARVKTNLENLRKKYKNSLNSPAELKNSDGIDMTDIFNGDDIFDTELQQRLKENTYGVYTYEEGVLEKSKQDKPLWICISWTPADMHHLPYLREIHRSFMEHFNFDYVYDYFFRPELVKNKPYTILNEAIQKAHLASYKNRKEEKPAASKTLPANVYFFDDFSGNTIGEKPKGWYVPSVGVPSIITTPNGEEGKWVKLEQHPLMPNDKGKPLPENFKMEFDVLTDKDFATNTGGAFRLRIHNKILRTEGDYQNAPKQIFIDLDAMSGNAKFTQNAAGYVRLKTTYTGMISAIRYADVLQYSNDFSSKTYKVHFTITRQGNKVRGYVDGKEIIALDKNRSPISGFNELPEGTRFTSFHFENISNKKEVGIYVSNIIITSL